MAGEYLSVAEAAELLGVHPQRVYQRVREGSLPAGKVGNQWLIEMSEVRRIKGAPRPGRPLSSKSAWALLAVAKNELAASELSPSARSRARSRLRNLISRVSSADVDDAAALLVSALRNRAERALFVASPRDLPDIRDDQRVHLSGVSLPQSNMSAADLAEGYVAAGDVTGLVGDYLLSPAARARANVVLHVVPSDVENSALAVLDEIASSPLALAADLAEHDGVRERSEAIRAIAKVHTTLVVRSPHAVGGDRG